MTDKIQIPFTAMITRTDFSTWDRGVLNKFARDAADALASRNADAERFVMLANIALNRDEKAAIRMAEICPDPKDIDDLRDVIDRIKAEKDNE